MKKILFHLFLGLFLLITGIFLLNANFYLGTAVIGVGAVIAASANIRFLIAMVQWSVAKGEENRRKKESRARPTKSRPKMEPQTEALLQAIRERSKEDPLVGAKIGAKEVFQRLLDGMKGPKGVHIESLLAALGALAGYACQANLRAQALTKGMPETAAFQVVTTKDGKQYFFGDPLNDALAASQHSVWGLVGGAAQHAGAKDFPDLNEVFQHTSSVLGTEQFGVPRIPENHQPADKPVNYLKTLWPALFPTVKMFCPNPVDWPILYSLAIQEAIYAGKETIDPSLAFRIVMESAIPMSKVDLANT